MTEATALDLARAMPRRLSERATVPVLAATVTLVSWARLPWDARKVLWAEDGHLFLAEGMTQGFWPTLFKPYTGYLQFWPRILTELGVRTGDLGLYSDRIALLCCLAVGLLAAGVYVWSKDWVPSRVLRIMLAAIPAIVSTAPIEVLGNVANLHWFLLWASIWLVIYRPRSRLGAVLLALTAATLALTEIQVALVLPLFLLRLRDRRIWLIRAALVAGLAAQGVATVSAPRESLPDHLSLGSTVLGYLINGPMSLIIGDSSTAGTVLAASPWTLPLISVVPFLGLLAYVLVRGDRSIRLIALTMGAGSFAMWFAASWVNLSPTRTPGFDYANFTPDKFSSFGYFRYGYVPSVFLLGIVVLAISVAMSRRTGLMKRGRVRVSGKAGYLIVIGVAGAILALQASNFTPAWTMRGGGPQWAAGVQEARSTCQTTSATVAQLPEAPSGWSVELPCAFLK